MEAVAGYVIFALLIVVLVRLAVFRVPQGHAQGPVRQLSQRHDVLSLDAEHRDASCVAQTFFKRTHEPGVLASDTGTRHGVSYLQDGPPTP